MATTAPSVVVKTASWSVGSDRASIVSSEISPLVVLQSAAGRSSAGDDDSSRRAPTRKPPTVERIERRARAASLPRRPAASISWTSASSRWCSSSGCRAGLVGERGDGPVLEGAVPDVAGSGGDPLTWRGAGDHPIGETGCGGADDLGDQRVTAPDVPVDGVGGDVEFGGESTHRECAWPLASTRARAVATMSARSRPVRRPVLVVVSVIGRCADFGRGPALRGVRRSGTLRRSD